VAKHLTTVPTDQLFLVVVTKHLLQAVKRLSLLNFGVPAAAAVQALASVAVVAVVL
jgi:hypothetical protein